MSLIVANANAVLGARSAGTHQLLPRRQGIVVSFNGTDQTEVCDRGGADPLPTQQVTPGSTVNVSFDVSEEFRGRTFNVSSVSSCLADWNSRIECSAWNDYPRNETITEPFFQWTVEPYRRTLANGSLTGEFNTPGSSIIFSAIVLPEGGGRSDNNTYTFYTSNNFTIVDQITPEGAATPTAGTPVGWKMGALSSLFTLGLLLATVA